MKFFCILFLALAGLNPLMAVGSSKDNDQTWPAKVISKQVTAFPSLTCFYVAFDDGSTPFDSENESQMVILIPTSQSEKLKPEDDLLFIFSEPYFFLNITTGEIFSLDVSDSTAYWIAHPLQRADEVGAA